MRFDSCRFYFDLSVVSLFGKSRTYFFYKPNQFEKHLRLRFLMTFWLGRLTGFFLLLVSAESFSQDIAFSQFYNSPVQLNPALSGTTKVSRVIFNYRNQWPSFNNAFITNAVSWDQFFSAINGGVGVQITNDQLGAGIYSANSVSLAYSYNIAGQDFATRFSLQGNFIQKKIDFNRLVFYDQIDPVNGFNNLQPTSETINTQQKSFVDFSAGILGYNKSTYMGLVFKHITQPDESFTGNDNNGKLPVAITAHFGHDFKSKKNSRSKTIFSPNLLFVQQSKFKQLNVGTYLTLGNVFGGMWFRYSFNRADALIFLAGLKKSIFKIGYSYDVSLNLLASKSGGAHELSLSLLFGAGKKGTIRRNLKLFSSCPEIF